MIFAGKTRSAFVANRDCQENPAKSGKRRENSQKTPKTLQRSELSIINFPKKKSIIASSRGLRVRGKQKFPQR